MVYLSEASKQLKPKSHALKDRKQSSRWAKSYNCNFSRPQSVVAKSISEEPERLPTSMEAMHESTHMTEGPCQSCGLKSIVGLYLFYSSRGFTKKFSSRFQNDFLQ